VHLVGHMTGAAPGARDVSALFAKYPNLTIDLPPLGNGEGVTYTQWEAWLALYHRKDLYIVEAAESAERGPKYVPTDDSRAGQTAHLKRLREAKRYPGFTFMSPLDLANYLKSTGILDLLVRAYAEEEARARHVAEGFIREMAQKVAGDRALDFEGMRQAVRNAIDIYEREIAGGQTQTNIDAIVDEALARARALVDAGKSGLAQAALRKAAEEMRREEEERRERYVMGVTALYHRARDIALASYDGAAAAEAIVSLAETVHGADAAGVARSLHSEAEALYEYGGDRGSNVHLIALIALRRNLLDAASSEHERGIGLNNLGIALWTLGERESGTTRLEEAVTAFREALKERTRERVPLDWAMTQNNLGTALATLGNRERGTGRLKEAVLTYREALKEYTRERVPLDWATTQMNLGNALWRLGERERGTGRLEAAVLAYREALKEYTQERVPLDWAMTQNNLGNALQTLGERESGTARLEEAVSAYREALKERTQERVPLDWAKTQNNLGAALRALGERESGTARLEEAVLAYHEALKERTQECVPLDWATTQNNLGNALWTLGARDSGTGRLEAAVLAYREALKERTQEGVPLDWAKTQNNLGNALRALGARESSAVRLEEAVLAYHEALKELTRERVPLDWARSNGNQGVAMMLLADRKKDAAMSTAALGQIEAAFEAVRAGGHEPLAAYFEARLPGARAILARLEAR
jgi:tetratricopeptide (TPR) repeat protein